jgi:hypothetical protein
VNLQPRADVTVEEPGAGVVRNHGLISGMPPTRIELVHAVLQEGQRLFRSALLPLFPGLIVVLACKAHRMVIDEAIVEAQLP